MTTRVERRLEKYHREKYNLYVKDNPQKQMTYDDWHAEFIAPIRYAIGAALSSKDRGEEVVPPE